MFKSILFILAITAIMINSCTRISNNPDDKPVDKPDDNPSKPNCVNAKIMNKWWLNTLSNENFFHKLYFDSDSTFLVDNDDYHVSFNCLNYKISYYSPHYLGGSFTIESFNDSILVVLNSSWLYPRERTFYYTPPDPTYKKDMISATITGDLNVNLISNVLVGRAYDETSLYIYSDIKVGNGSYRLTFDVPYLGVVGQTYKLTSEAPNYLFCEFYDDKTNTSYKVSECNFTITRTSRIYIEATFNFKMNEKYGSKKISCQDGKLIFNLVP